MTFQIVMLVIMGSCIGFLIGRLSVTVEWAACLKKKDKNGDKNAEENKPS